MNQEINHDQSKSRLLPALAVVLFAALIALLSAQASFAQDGDDGSGNNPVYNFSSIEDLENLPPHIRERFEKENSLSAADSYEIGDSDKSPSTTLALPGDEVSFTIVARNTGDAQTPVMTVVDTLPAELSYVDHEFKIPSGGQQTGGGVNGNVVTWEGVLVANGSVEIIITAMVEQNTPIGTTITNQAVITAGEQTAEPQASIEIVDEINMPFSFMPIVTYGELPKTPDISQIQATRPNSQNDWTVSWSAPGGVLYELQESNSPGFENAALMEVGAEAQKSFDHQPSPFNTFYYRARSKSGDSVGNWSQTLKVVGAYRDEFDDFNSGWELVRRSHLDEVHDWYEFFPDPMWLILQVEGRWDMGLTSPLAEAPSLPYSMETVVQSVHPGWQKGYGIVFEGDKDTENCPSDPNTVDGWYKHKDCFNQFYEFMLVEGADRINLQVQSIAEVVWVGTGSGGIPVHRSAAETWYSEGIPGVSFDDWNRMRADVYQDRIEFWVGRIDSGMVQQLVIDQNIFQGNAYFGLIATTQEYSNITARHEYFSITPIDN